VPGTTVRPANPHKLVCVLVGDDSDPVVAAQHCEERSHPRDSGFMVFTTSAPDSPDEATDDDFCSYCLHC
jgi:hypothetical protein